MDLGFVTHGVHSNSRLVYLVNSVITDDEISVTGPPNGEIYPPGPGWIYAVVDGVPSVGVKVMVGSGEGPPVDETAISRCSSFKARSCKHGTNIPRSVHSSTQAEKLHDRQV